MKQFGLILLTSLALSSGVAQAATYYVSKAGSNTNSCAQAQSDATPKLTVVAGIACLSGGGDTLYVHKGDYSEGISSSPSGTSWNNKVRIAAYPGETVWLRPVSNSNSAGGSGMVIWLDGDYHYIEFDGINLDGRNLTGAGYVMWVSTNNGNNPHHIRIQNAEIIAGPITTGAAIGFGGHTAIGATGSNEAINVTIHGGGIPGLCGIPCGSLGIYLEGPDNLVDGADIYDVAAAGIQIYNAGGDAPNRNTIRNTRIHGIVRAGSSLDQVWGIIVVGDDSKIYNNVIDGIAVGNVNSGNAAIAIGGGSARTKLWNNTLYNNRNTGIFIDSGTSNTDIRNNIVYQSSGSNYIDASSNTVQANNLFGVNPLFVDSGSGDFHLQSNSPAVNAGASVSGVSTDLKGTPRPQGDNFDIGAYEFTSAVQATPPAAPAGLRIVSY